MNQLCYLPKMDHIVKIESIDDRESLCIYYNQLRSLFPKRIQSNESEQIFTYMIPLIHELVSRNPTFNVYLHLEGLRIKDLLEIKSLVINSVTFFDQFVNRRLDHCYVVRAPCHVDNLFNMIKPLINKHTKEKIVFVN